MTINNLAKILHSVVPPKGSRSRRLIESAAWLIGVVSGILGIGAYFSSNAQSARIEEALAKQNAKLDRIEKAMSHVSESGQTAKAGLDQISLELAKIERSAETVPSSSLAEEQSRFLTLSSRAADLQLQIQQISQQRLYLANMVSGMFNESAALEPGSEKSRALALRIANLQSADKTLELQLRRLDTQAQSVSTELDAVKRIIGRNIERSFRTMGSFDQSLAERSA